MSKVEICGINTANLPKISNERSQTLLKLIADGDKNAREEFIIANFRLVLSIIKRFNLKNANPDDVFQAGVIGLIKAIDNFDLSVNVMFSTYAVPMIIGEVKRFLKGGNSLRVARSIRDTAYEALRVRAELEKQDESPSLERVAKEMKVDLKDVVYALDAISDTLSLYEPVFNKNGDELLLMDSLGDEKNVEERWIDSVSLWGAVGGLNEREKTIIKLRYYEGKTQTEISEEIGISQAQVSRLEKQALKDIENVIRV